MNNKNNQAGSAHLIIIIVLVIALLGSLGFVFWQNVIQKKTNTVSNQDTSNVNKSSNNLNVATTNEIALTEVAADNMLSTGLAIKYPKTWKVTHESIGPLSSERIMTDKYDISNPNSNIIIHLMISNGGFGGTCEKLQGDELIQINAEEIPNYSDARFATYYGADYYFAGIQNNNEKIRSVKVGDSGCDFGLSGSLTNIKNSGALDGVNLHLQVELTDVGHNGASSVEKFKEVIKTDDFKTAKQIIESLYVKN